MNNIQSWQILVNRKEPATNSDHSAILKKLCRTYCKSYPLGNKYPGVSLSRLQAQYVYALLNGKKIQDIHIETGKASYSIKSTLNKAKAKFEVFTIKEMLDLIKKTDFIKNYERGDQCQS